MCEFSAYTIASYIIFIFFFFNDTATTEIYTLSLHDALPISRFSDHKGRRHSLRRCLRSSGGRSGIRHYGDRKSTRLNSSHLGISYAVFCLKKKNERVHHIVSTTEIPLDEFRLVRQVDATILS